MKNTCFVPCAQGFAVCVGFALAWARILIERRASAAVDVACSRVAVFLFVALIQDPFVRLQNNPFLSGQRQACHTRVLAVSVAQN